MDLGDVRASIVEVGADRVRLRLSTPNEDVQLELTFSALHIAELMLVMTQQAREEKPRE